jgi:hypothetical protein
MKDMALCNMRAQLKHLGGSICKVYQIKTILKVFKHHPKKATCKQMGQMLECQLEGFKGKFKILVWFVIFFYKKGRKLY